LKIGVEPVDDLRRATDHHRNNRPSSPQTPPLVPTSTWMAALIEHFGAADVVLPKGIAAVEDDVTRLQQLCQLGDDVFGDLAGGQQSPRRPAASAAAARCLSSPAAPGGAVAH